MLSRISRKIRFGCDRRGRNTRFRLARARPAFRLRQNARTISRGLGRARTKFAAAIESTAWRHMASFPEAELVAGGQQTNVDRTDPNLCANATADGRCENVGHVIKSGLHVGRGASGKQRCQDPYACAMSGLLHSFGPTTSGLQTRVLLEPPEPLVRLAVYCLARAFRAFSGNSSGYQ